MTPGNRWVYDEIDEEGSVLKVQVTVTEKTSRSRCRSGASPKR
jgi:hypothetical protein